MTEISVIEIRSSDLVEIDRIRGNLDHADVIGVLLKRFLESIQVPEGLTPNRQLPDARLDPVTGFEDLEAMMEDAPAGMDAGSDTDANDDFPGFATEDDHDDFPGFGDAGDEATGFDTGNGPVFPDGPAFDHDGDRIEPGSCRKKPAGGKPLPESFTSLIRNMVDSDAGETEDEDDVLWISDDEDEEKGSERLSGSDERVTIGDIVIYRRLSDPEGFPTKAFFLQEIDKDVDPQQYERSLNLDARTVYSYQAAGKAILAMKTGDHVNVKIAGADPFDIEIISLMKADKK